ncbi:hypothetical protein [Deinococcus ficus]|uniref:hypothetical protein n=1 Tax=Deinococcus ficus TaxID=317577 RepID=UPI00042A70DF|nr:hypothetical protein [Deinococcus ficus]
MTSLPRPAPKEVPTPRTFSKGRAYAEFVAWLGSLSRPAPVPLPLPVKEIPHG